MVEIEKFGSGYRARTAREALVLRAFKRGEEGGWGIWYEGVEKDPDEVLMVVEGKLTEAVGELVDMALHQRSTDASAASEARWRSLSRYSVGVNHPELPQVTRDMIGDAPLRHLDQPATLATRTGTKPEDWVEMDGPEGGLGVDYWFGHEANGWTASITIDGDHVSISVRNADEEPVAA